MTTTCCDVNYVNGNNDTQHRKMMMMMLLLLMMMNAADAPQLLLIAHKKSLNGTLKCFFCCHFYSQNELKFTYAKKLIMKYNYTRTHIQTES